MWIILLDHSSSMGDPFSSEVSQAGPGRVRQVEAETKWEAAKRTVMDEVGALNTDEPVCLIAFTSVASIVFEGVAADSDGLGVALDGLSPNNGTDIAAALNMAAEYAARAAAAHISVEVILIDPTDEGRTVAEAIQIRGRVTQVFSAPQLRQQAPPAAERHTNEVR